jgi:hypothetical protein
MKAAGAAPVSGRGGRGNHSSGHAFGAHDRAHGRSLADMLRRGFLVPTLVTAPIAVGLMVLVGQLA